MQKVIDNLVYDTETADRLCDVSGPGGYSRSDFQWEDTWLYRTKNGRFFIAGEGGAMTRWAMPMGQNGRTGGSGLAAITEEQARELLATHGSAEAYRRFFPDVEEA
jgi:hypothetical protein